MFGQEGLKTKEKSLERASASSCLFIALKFLLISPSKTVSNFVFTCTLHASWDFLSASVTREREKSDMLCISQLQQQFRQKKLFIELFPVIFSISLVIGALTF